MRMKSKGIALLLTVGILTLLAFAAAAMGAVAAAARTVGSVTIDSAHVRLLARSGVEYASARLFEDSAPKVPATTANQADDWTCRDGMGISLEKVRNPSYSQAEPYRDVNANGAYDDGLDGFTDLNGNARFDAWSGRLRGRYGMTSGTFALKISEDGGKISVNGGIVDLPVHNQVSMVPQNGRIADLIDTLLEVLRPLPLQDWSPGAADRVTPRYEAGERIILNRPPGGYKSLEEAMSRSGIPADQWGLLEKYLTIEAGGRVQMISGAKNRDRRRLVPLSCADPDLLEALFRNLSSGLLYQIRRLAPPKEMCLHFVAARITPPDARALAAFLSSERPFASWYDLYARLNQGKSTIFLSAPEQQAEIEAVRPLFLHMAGLAYMPTAGEIRNQQVDLAFANANPDNMEARGDHFSYTGCRWVPPLSWVSYDIPRQENPIAPARVERTLNKPHLSKVRPVAGSGSGASALLGPPGSPFGTLELSLETNAVFAVESLGKSERGKALTASRRFSASVQPVAVVSVRVQDEFENSGSGARWNLPEEVTVCGKPDKDRVQTFPMFPRESCPDLPEKSPDPAVRDAYQLGSPFAGDLRLMHYASGDPQGSVFYTPIWEDGQPMRVPLHPASWLENYLDLVKGAVPWPSKINVSGSFGPAPNEQAQRDFLTSGTSMIYKGSSSNGITDRGAIFPGTLFCGFYVWSATGNPGAFPMEGDDGTVQAGTIELWSGDGVYEQNNPLQSTLTVSDILRWSEIQPLAGGFSGSEALAAPGFLTQPDWHHVAVVFDTGNPPLEIYSDGIRVAAGVYQANASNPNKGWPVWGGHPPTASLANPTLYDLSAVPQCETRLYQKALLGVEVGAHASQSRFWTKDLVLARPDLTRVPSYTSPLYRFDHPVQLLRVRWDGFVPKKVADALEAGDPAPLRVEFLCYDAPGGSDEPRWIVPCPAEAWQMGGGGFDFETLWKTAYPGEPQPKIGAFSYKVWLDVSAVSGFNNETPVFDSIEVQFRTGGKSRNVHEK